MFILGNSFPVSPTSYLLLKIIILGFISDFTDLKNKVKRKDI